MLSLFDSLRDLSLAGLVFRFFSVIVCGGLIGYERANHGRAAGLRTHAIVALGACLVMVTNQYICTYISPDSEPARLGAQVISGIGFLGAGSIIVSGRQITGLTTAAGLWTAACIGLAFGIGFYEGGFIATFLVLFTMIVLYKLELHIKYTTRNMDIAVELTQPSDVSVITDTFKENSITIHDIEITTSERRVSEPGHALVIMSIRVNKGWNINNVAELLKSKVSVITLKEI